jgi:sugar-specific transcriptional regulator TrmB
MDVATVECLVQLGFSQTEAKVYCTMVSEEKMNGYQIAKALGTSRSSVYAALENLLDKGAIVSIPGQTSEYAVIEPVQLIDKITSKYKKNAETAKKYAGAAFAEKAGLEFLLQYSGNAESC